jgi:hypothetical protein
MELVDRCQRAEAVFESTAALFSDPSEAAAVRALAAAVHRLRETALKRIPASVRDAFNAALRNAPHC